MTDALQLQAEVLAGQDEDTLFELLGSEEVAREEGLGRVLEDVDPELAGTLEESGALPRRRTHTSDELVQRGRQRFEALLRDRRQALQDAVCPKWREMQGGALVDVVVTVAPNVAGVLGGAEPITASIAVAVLLTKRGLDKLCKDSTDESNGD